MSHPLNNKRMPQDPETAMDSNSPSTEQNPPTPLAKSKSVPSHLLHASATTQQVRFLLHSIILNIKELTETLDGQSMGLPIFGGVGLIGALHRLQWLHTGIRRALDPNDEPAIPNIDWNHLVDRKIQLLGEIKDDLGRAVLAGTLDKGLTNKQWGFVEGCGEALSSLLGGV